MFTGKGTVQGRGTNAQLGRRLGASVSAVALAVLLTGNVAAFQLEGDGTRTATLVTPKVSYVSGSSQWMRFKLSTSAGHKVLVYG